MSIKKSMRFAILIGLIVQILLTTYIWRNDVVSVGTIIFFLLFLYVAFPQSDTMNPSKRYK